MPIFCLFVLFFLSVTFLIHLIFKKRKTFDPSFLQLKKKNILPEFNFKTNWLVYKFIFFFNIKIFYKWILRLKFFFKFYNFKNFKLKVAPLNIKLFLKKTKNSRMGKGKGTQKSVNLLFKSCSLFLDFGYKSKKFISFFFFNSLKSIQKRFKYFFFSKQILN